MSLFRRTAALLVVAAAMLGAGCATAASTDDTPVQVQFNIENNRPGLGGVTAFLVTPAGARVSFGPIESNRTGSWTRTVRPGLYTLVAGRVGGDDIVSERFRIEAQTAVISWNLNANQLVFGER